MAIVEYNGVKYNTSNKELVKTLLGILGFLLSGLWGSYLQNVLEKRKKEDYTLLNKNNSSLSYNKNYNEFNRNNYLVNLANSSYDPKAKLEVLRYKKELTTLKSTPYIDNSKLNDFIKNKRVVLGKTYDITDPNLVGELLSAINKYLGAEHLTVDKIKGQRTELAINSLDLLKKYYDNKRKGLKKGEKLAVNKNAFLINKNGKTYGTTPFSNGMYQEFDKTTGRYKDITDSERGAALVDGKLYDADTEASKLQELTGQKVTGKWTNENLTYMSNMYNNAFQKLSDSYNSSWKGKEGSKYRNIIAHYDSLAKEARRKEAEKRQSLTALSASNDMISGNLAYFDEISKDINYDSLGKLLTKQLEKDFKINLSNTSSSSGNLSYYSKALLQKILEAPENKNYAKALNYLKNSLKYLASLQHNDSYAEKMIKNIGDNLLLGAIHNINKSNADRNKNKSEFAQGFKAENQLRELKNLQKIGWSENDEKIAQTAGFVVDLIPDLFIGIGTGGTGTAALETAKVTAKLLAITAAKNALKQGATKAAAKQLAEQAAKKYVKSLLGTIAKETAKNVAKAGAREFAYWTPLGTIVNAGTQAKLTGNIDWKEAGKAGLARGRDTVIIGGAIKALPAVGQVLKSSLSPAALKTLQAANFANTSYLVGRDGILAYNNFSEGNYAQGIGNTLGVGFDLMAGKWMNSALKNYGLGLRFANYNPSSKNFAKTYYNQLKLPFLKAADSAKALYKNPGALNKTINLGKTLFYTAEGATLPLGHYYLANTLYNQGFDRDTGNWSPFNIIPNTASDYVSPNYDEFNNGRMLTMVGIGNLTSKFNNYQINPSSVYRHTVRNLSPNYTYSLWFKNAKFLNKYTDELYNLMQTQKEFNTFNRYNNLAFASNSALPMTKDAWENYLNGNSNIFNSLGETYMAWSPFVTGVRLYNKDLGLRSAKMSSGTETADSAFGAMSKLTRDPAKYRQTMENLLLQLNTYIEKLPDINKLTEKLSRYTLYNEALTQLNAAKSDLRSNKIKLSKRNQELSYLLSHIDLVSPNLRAKFEKKINSLQLAITKLEANTPKLEKALAQAEYNLLQATTPEILGIKDEINTFNLNLAELKQEIADKGYILDRNSTVIRTNGSVDPESIFNKSTNFSNSKNALFTLKNFPRVVTYFISGNRNIKDALFSTKDDVLPFEYTESYRRSDSPVGSRRTAWDRLPVMVNGINYNANSRGFKFTELSQHAAPNTFLDPSQHYLKVSLRKVGDTHTNNIIEELADAVFSQNTYLSRNTRGSKQNFISSDGAIDFLTKHKREIKLITPKGEKVPFIVDGKINPEITKYTFAGHSDIGFEKHFLDNLNTGGVNLIPFELNGKTYTLMIDIDGPGSSVRGFSTRLAGAFYNHGHNLNITVDIIKNSEHKAFDLGSKANKYVNNPGAGSFLTYAKSIDPSILTKFNILVVKDPKTGKEYLAPINNGRAVLLPPKYRELYDAYVRVNTVKPSPITSNGNMVPFSQYEAAMKRYNEALKITPKSTNKFKRLFQTYIMDNINAWKDARNAAKFLELINAKIIDSSGNYLMQDAFGEYVPKMEFAGSLPLNTLYKNIGITPLKRKGGKLNNYIKYF